MSLEPFPPAKVRGLIADEIGDERASPPLLLLAAHSSSPCTSTAVLCYSRGGVAVG